LGFLDTNEPHNRGLMEVSMSSQSSQRRFTEEFKEQAVRQVTDWGHPVSEVASRLGVSTDSPYAWHG